MLYVNFVVDCSYSMKGSEAEVVKGLNDNIEKLRTDATKARISITPFSHDVNFVQGTKFIGKYPSLEVKNVKIKDFNPLKVPDYPVLGSTALYDAIVTGAKELKDSATKKGDRCQLLILTDGEENSSVNFGLKDVQEVAKEFKDKGWLFHMIGADFDALGETVELGIGSGNTINATKGGGMYEAIQATATMASGYAKSDDYKLFAEANTSFSASMRSQATKSDMKFETS